MTPACEFCRNAPATKLLSYPAKCIVVRKPVCDACARQPRVSGPFTLEEIGRNRPPRDV